MYHCKNAGDQQIVFTQRRQVLIKLALLDMVLYGQDIDFRRHAGIQATADRERACFLWHMGMFIK